MTTPKGRVEKLLTFLNDNALKNPRFWTIFFFVFCITFQASGFCDLKAVDNVTNETLKMIFSPTVRKIALVFGAGAGAVGAYTSGSIMPILKWGGLGLTVNYLPKIIDVINGLAT